jgi:predicted RNA-binding Zn-ribbon protein involved in translation (DUF1610 family)
MISVLLLTVGLVLLVRGLIGRRTDDHPYCRACGFDLTGRAADSTRCPECGRDVTQASAIRHGHRQRRGGLIAGGVAALLLGLVFVGPLVITSATSFDTQPYKPMWMLQREVRSGNAPVRGAALLELERRYKDGLLSSGGVASLVTLALDVQGDPTKPWNTKWGDIVELGRAKQQVSDEQWSRYARQAVPFNLLVRSKVRRRDPLTVGLQITNARVGNRIRLRAVYDSRDQRLIVDNLELPTEKDRGYSSGSFGLTFGGGGTHYEKYDIGPLLGQLGDGKHTVRYRSKIYVREHDDDTQALTVVDVDLTADIDLRPTNEPAITLTTDAALRDGMQRALTVEQMSVGRYQKDAGRLTVHLGGVPAGLGHTVWVRADEREWKVGQIACPAGKNNASYGLNGDLAGFPPDVTTVEVRLRPEPNIAAESIDTYDIWGEEIVIPDVKVERPAPPNPASGGGQ